ncbi:hypothetical protein E2562_030140 [Oryza meyeriana var. granulata]|uniref:Pentatricopeptide repeat-containing protein n=1 Tax=Oryza meyeriana var. granulata TaxID=110450 RepID=A0A6G1BNV2_9ORYZ|nr:hypothetical protein E2562_030140 [Oryza meyeriana var. granulata]
MCVANINSVHDSTSAVEECCVVAWNAMISGCTHGGVESQEVEMFGLMRAEGMRPDKLTFASRRTHARLSRVHRLRPNDIRFLAVLLACAHIGLFDKGL